MDSTSTTDSNHEPVWSLQRIHPVHEQGANIQKYQATLTSNLSWYYPERNLRQASNTRQDKLASCIMAFLYATTT